MFQTLLTTLREQLPQTRHARTWLVVVLSVCLVVQLGAARLALGVADWLSPSDPPEAMVCPASGGHLGMVQAPEPFAVAVGETWVLGQDRPVMALADEDAAIVCILPAGTKLVVLDAPVQQEGLWVPVVAEAVLASEPVLPPEPGQDDVLAIPEAAPTAEEEPAPLGGLCPGSSGSIVGYVQLKGPFLVSKGSTWTVMSDKVVVSSRPRADNGWRTNFPTVCRLPQGSRVKVYQKPTRIPQKGLWVPIFAGAARSGS